MVSAKRILVTLFSLSLLASGITSCDSGTNQKTETTPAATEKTSESTVDVPQDSESEPAAKDPGITPPSITPSVEPSIPNLEGATPAPSNPLTPNVKPSVNPIIVPPAQNVPPVPKDSPLPDDQGAVEPDGKGGILSPNPMEPKKPAPKPKTESKTQGQSATNAVANRKKVFAKALAIVPNKDAKFNEYYKKLDELVTKVESQKPLTQEAIDSVNVLNQQYPAEAIKFNAAMQKVMPAAKPKM
jgi:hypothetical protein